MNSKVFVVFLVTLSVTSCQTNDNSNRAAAAAATYTIVAPTVVRPNTDFLVAVSVFNIPIQDRKWPDWLRVTHNFTHDIDDCHTRYQTIYLVAIIIKKTAKTFVRNHLWTPQKITITYCQKNHDHVKLNLNTWQEICFSSSGFKTFCRAFRLLSSNQQKLSRSNDGIKIFQDYAANLLRPTIDGCIVFRKK